MAVTATFKADFSDFTDKVSKAEKDLKTFETSTTKVGSSVTAMGEQSKGAFAKMTSALGPLGAALGVTFSVGAVVAFAKQIASTSSELVKLSDQTGISLQGLQKFQVVADDAGNTLTQLTGAVSQMQNRLAGGDKSAHAALETLGLDFRTLKQLAPDQQFMQIADAIRQVEDPAQRVALAMDLFGKSGAAILPSIARGFEDVANASVGMSDRSVRAWNDMGNAVMSFLRNTKNAVGEWSGSVIASLHEVFGSAAADIAMLAKSTDQQLTALQASVKAKPLAAPGGIPALPVPDPAAQTQAMEAQLAALEKSTAAAQKYGEALQAVTQYGGDFQSTLADLNDDTEAAVKYYLEAGASAKDLATVYGLTDSQVKAISADMKFQESVVTQNSKAFANVSTSIANAETRMRQFHEAAYGVQSDLTLMNVGLDRIGAAGVVMGQGMSDGSAKIAEALGRNTPSITEFLSKAVGGMQGLGVAASGLVGAFTGGGGVAGAATGMAKTVASSLLGMVPIVGPILSQFAGPLVEGFKKMHEKIMEGFKALHGKIKELFGGPSGDELAGREIVDKFQDNLGSMLNETQKVEAGNEQWKATVIAIRDAYLAQGLTAEEAMADAQRLWGATGAGAEASKVVVAEVEQKMKGMADQTKTATDQANALADALGDVGRAAGNINFPSGNPSVGVPGYATGTGGRFINFGAGTLAMLHGRERVMTEGEAPGTDPAMLGALQAIRRDLQRQPELIALQLRAALAQV